MLKKLFLSIIFISGTVSGSDCFDMAGRDYQIDPDLLRAVAITESSGRSNAMNIVSSERYAVGMMQIHSNNFPHLSEFGITPGKLYADSCLNIYTGAYYLAIAFKRWGYNWRSVGAYNAGFKETKRQDLRRKAYSRKVWRNYRTIKANNSQNQKQR